MAFKIFEEETENTGNLNKINNKKTGALKFDSANEIYNKICGDRIRINQSMWAQFYQSYIQQDMNYNDSFQNFKHEFLSIRRRNGLQKRRRRNKKEVDDRLW